MKNKSTLVLACATVIEEMIPLIPDTMDHKVFDFGLHTTPKILQRTLQETIDQLSKNYKTIILGYGLCSLALAGISAPYSQIVAPKVDDCIAIFLGSRKVYQVEFNNHPGTYYLTKGWIETGDTPFSEYERNLIQYGKEKADLIYKMMMEKYTRLVLILTSKEGMDPYREYSQNIAKKFGLTYTEVLGSTHLIRKLLQGPWDDEIIVKNPKIKIGITDFHPTI